MKRLFILSMPVLLTACFSKQDKKKLENIMKEMAWVSNYTYVDSRDTLEVLQVGAEKGPLEENSTVSLTSKGSNFRSYSGKYTDYLKDGQWMYQTGKRERTAINWAAFMIGDFIKTNLPARGNTTTIDSHTEKYILTVKQDSITILFHADTLSARVKRRPYEDLVKEEMQNRGFTLSSTENKLLQDSSNTISVTSMQFKKGKEELLYKTAYAVLQSGYLAYAMQYDAKNQVSAELLFDGVLTNLFLNEERFYYPFRKKEKTIEQQEKDSL
jgi:hypothetical protein